MEESSRSTFSILPWDRFHKWIHSFCVVTFDLEVGQALELIYPKHVSLPDSEKMNVCYLAFPDSHSGCSGDTQFSFRIRHRPPKSSVESSDTLYNDLSPSALQSSDCHLHGYVCFRQKRDKSIRRGYYQKSVVLLSRLPLHHLWNHVIQLIGPQYFDNGEPGLEAACHDIDQWSAPQPGLTLHLPLAGCVTEMRIPCRADAPSSSIGRSPAPVRHPILIALPTPHEVDVYSALQPILAHIQLLWELVMLAEPIVVMTPSPGSCAQAVLSLVSCIWPLKFACDYRPFFTIHDSEFKEYTTKTQAPPQVILGVTNPFFVKTLQHWPHVIRIGSMMNLDVKGDRKKKGPTSKSLESKPGVYTRYKPFLQKDKTILKRLSKGLQSGRPAEAQNSLLKRFLLELTQSFMIPLERYMASLMPLQRNVSPFKGPPRLKSFNVDDFICSIEVTGPQLTSGLKGDWTGLYRRFFESPHFTGWYRSREQEVTHKLESLHLHALAQANLDDWLKGRHEVEIVDMILKLKERIAWADKTSVEMTEEARKQLSSHLTMALAALPEDLRASIRTS